METMRRSRTALAILLAVVVAGVAVADGATAGGDAVTKALVKKIAKRKARAQIRELAPGLKVAEAAKAGTANSAATATFANSAQPALFARVLADGSVDAANSKGIVSANVSTAGPGTYCFSAPAGVRGGQVIVDYATAALGDATAQFGLGVGAGCPAGTRFFVSTFSANGTGGSNDDSGFFIHVYR